MSNTVLSVKDATRVYKQGGQELRVLAGVSLEINAGEVVALVGESGSGKTTLLQCVGLLDRPTSGDIAVNGQSVVGLSDNARTGLRRKYLGFVYQFHHLLPEFSALENVAMPQVIAGVSIKKAQEAARTLLDELGLSERLQHRPAELSGGEQQRVAIARALANEPSLLLADEPTGNLDPQTAESVFQMFLALAKKRGLAVLMATHNMELAARMGRVVRMKSGLLV